MFVEVTRVEVFARDGIYNIVLAARGKFENNVLRFGNIGLFYIQAGD
jgi:hypothetical protein